MIVRIPRAFPQMPPGSRRHEHIRERIAAAAARIMAEDGIDSFALAKRKAARQLGAESSKSLPNNEEIEDQLRTYLSLYQADEQRERLQYLREQALAMMELLKPFRPYLAGAVLKGTAGRYSGIDLQLFTDDAKAVELLLLNRGIAYEVARQRYYSGDQAREAIVLKLACEGVQVNVAVHAANDERSILKATVGGRPLERAGYLAVTSLVERGS
jgi:hypothetical protein